MHKGTVTALDVSPNLGVKEAIRQFLIVGLPA